MNIHEFENLVLKLFHLNKRLIRNAGKIDVERSGGETFQKIIAYDGNKMVGFVDFFVNESNKLIWVNLIQVQEEYKNSNVIMKLLKEFHSLYKERYWGWDIGAKFYNQEFYEFFDRAVQKGWFPEGINKTEKASPEEIEEYEGQSYDEWVKNSDETYFSINRQVNLDELPAPYMRLSDQEKSNFFGMDVIYKNLTEEELTTLTNAAQKYLNTYIVYNKMQVNGQDIYYSLGSLMYSSLVVSSTDAQVLAYIDYYSEKPEVIAISVDLIEKYAENIASFLETEVVSVFLCDEPKIENVQTTRAVGTWSVFNLEKLKEAENSKAASIKSRLKKVGDKN